MDNNNTSPTPFDLSMVLGPALLGVRVLECTLGQSTKGFPQLAQTLEFANNPVKMIRGVPVDINGFSLRSWQILTDKSLRFVNAQRAALGLPSVSSIEQITPEEYIGTTGVVLAANKLTPIIDQSDNNPVIDPNTGAAMARGNIDIQSWHPRGK